MNATAIALACTRSEAERVAITGHTGRYRTLICEQCGREYSLVQYEVRRNRRFCSVACFKEMSTTRGRKNLPTRFWSKVDKDGPIPAHRPELGPCWVWTGTLNAYGYGRLLAPGAGGGPLAAHRVSWEMHNGEIGDGLFVCHRCDNPACVNPAHLFLGTAAENSADMASKKRATRGEAVNTAKLTVQDVAEIRALYASGKPPRGTQRALATRFGVNRGTILRVVAGETW